VTPSGPHVYKLSITATETGPGMFWERDCDIYLATMVPEMVLRGRYFRNCKTDFSNVASHMITCAAAATNHKTATSLFADLSSFRFGEVAVEFYSLNL